MADRPSETRYAVVDQTVVGPDVTQLVAGVAEYDIVLINGSFIADADMDVSLEDGDGTNRLGPYSLGAEGGWILPDSNVGHTRFGTGEAMSIRMSAAGQCGGGIAYRLFPQGMEIG